MDPLDEINNMCALAGVAHLCERSCVALNPTPCMHTPTGTHRCIASSSAVAERDQPSRRRRQSQGRHPSPSAPWGAPALKIERTTSSPGRESRQVQGRPHTELRFRFVGHAPRVGNFRIRAEMRSKHGSRNRVARQSGAQRASGEWRSSSPDRRDQEGNHAGHVPVEVERHRVLNSGRYDTYPNVKPAIRDYAEKMRNKSDPMEVGTMAH